jgi:hypothetical protein
MNELQQDQAFEPRRTIMNGLKLAFGALSDPIEAQLREQGYTLADADTKFQRAADAISYLRITGYLTDSAVNSTTKKLMKSIVKSIRNLS